MTLDEYISAKRGNATALATELGVALSQLSNMAKGRDSISAQRCVLIEQITKGQVTRRELRPDWRDIWPELERRSTPRATNVKVA